MHAAACLLESFGSRPTAMTGALCVCVCRARRSNRPVRQSRKRGAPAWRGMLSGGDGAALDDITNDDEDLASLVAMGFDEKKSREARATRMPEGCFVAKTRPLNPVGALRRRSELRRRSWRPTGTCSWP